MLIPVYIVFACLNDIHRENLHKLSQQTAKTSSFCLYPGYLTKENGRIYWTEQAPVRQNNKWVKTNSVDVTNCIFDPFPYTSGDQNSVLCIDQKSNN